MTESTDSDDDEALDDLVAACLDRAEREGQGAIDALCEEHPDHADALRERIELLEGAGLWSPPMPETIPDRLGEFELIRRLGEGGMGVVYLAEQSSLDRLVALKVVRPTQLYFPGTRERFQREVSIVARLQHPNIVPIFTVGEAEGLPYFAMEYIEGCTLGDVLDELGDRAPTKLTGGHMSRIIGDLAPRDSSSRQASWGSGRRSRRRSRGGRDARAASGVADSQARTPPAANTERDAADTSSWIEACLHIAVQIADALQHAHERGIIHRDIKPSNVLLTADGTARLTDFGLAKVDDPLKLSRTGQMIGTPYYMSPEQVSRVDAPVDERTDVYSLGIVLFEALTLALPFPGDSAPDVFDKILTRPPIAPRAANPAVPRDLEAVCLRAIAKRPADRYDSAADFADDLRRHLRGEPTRARPLSAPVRMLRSLEALSPVVLQLLCLAVIVGWWSVETFVLEPASVIDPGVHVKRLWVAGTGALVFAWLASALTRRLLRPRRWGAAVGLVLALGLGILAFTHIEEGRRAQRYEAEKSALMKQIEFELRIFGTASPELIHDFARAHDARLNEDDLALTIAALGRDRRYDDARAYSARLATLAPDAPAVHAFAFVYAVNAGQLDEAARHDAALWATTDAPPTRWLRAADILSSYRRPDMARRALERGSKGSDNVLRDQFNLRLVMNSIELCRDDEARRFLAPYLAYGDPGRDALMLELKLMRTTGEHAVTVEELLEHVQAIEESDWVTPHYIALNRNVAARLPGIAAEWLLELVDEYPRDVQVLETVAQFARGTGLPEAQQLFERLLDVAQTMAADDVRDHYAGVALLGLSAIAMSSNDVDRALALARDAMQRVPHRSEAHTALANILIVRAQNEHGEIPAETLRECLALFRESTRLSGESPQALNNAAYALVLVNAAEPDPDLLTEARWMLERAQYMLASERVGDCPASAEHEHTLAKVWSTEVSVLEAQGDADGALRAARTLERIATEAGMPSVARQAQQQIEQLEMR